MWKELKIPAVYTMEASFCGTNFGPNQGFHFTTESMMETGRKLLMSLFIYCDIDIPKAINDINKPKRKADKNCNTIISGAQMEFAHELKDLNRKNLINELMSNKQLLNMGSKEDESGEDGGGSDSDPSEDNMEEEEMAKIIPIKIKSIKKKQEARKSS